MLFSNVMIWTILVTHDKELCIIIRVDGILSKSSVHTGIPHFITFHFILLHRYVFLHTEDRTLHQQKDYDWPYCNTSFIVTLAVLWHWLYCSGLSGTKHTISPRYAWILLVSTGILALLFFVRHIYIFPVRLTSGNFWHMETFLHISSPVIPQCPIYFSTITVPYKLTLCSYIIWYLFI